MLSRIVNAVGFWLLTLLAFALFAPPVLAPLIRENRELHASEVDLRHANITVAREAEDLDHAVQQHRQRDPQVLRQLAQERLNYQPRTGQPVPLLPAPDEAEQEQAAAAEGGQLDRSLKLSGDCDQAGPLTGLAQTDLFEQLCKPRTKKVLLGLAAAALTLAFVLFGGLWKKPDAA
ncbi:MAG: hypothetical protein BIFFINMI_01108 [Phycisphaerae bacterium]|nr:hypothetical protein [Phycisphaerae bacterium]